MLFYWVQNIDLEVKFMLVVTNLCTATKRCALVWGVVAIWVGTLAEV